ncbi:MAG: nodulation protein NodH [Hasllibacter sp.]
MKGFVLFAEMRTGSNHLEASLNAMNGVTCHGEAFNNAFVGYPNRAEALGFDLARRRADPAAMLDAIAAAEGVNGFRYFHDHDPRVFDLLMADDGWRKIVLTRDPLDSFVSLEIARATGQWKLTQPKHRKTAKITFDPARFETHRAAVEGFAARRRRALQERGQTAFEIGFDEIGDPGVIAGLARFLGVPPPARLGGRLVRQNPPDLRAKVENHDAMMAAVGGARTAPGEAEPARAAAVPSWRAVEGLPLVYMPVRGGPEAAVAAWLGGFGAALPAFDQKRLRQWKRRHPGHRGFTVVRHPVSRMHAVFVERFLGTGEGAFLEIRERLRTDWNVPLPDGAPGPDWDRGRQRDAFLGFMRFVKENLSGQTPIRVDGQWASQVAQVSAFAQVSPPDLVLREDELPEGLPRLAGTVGAEGRAYAAPGDPAPVPLADYYDDEVEAAVRGAYQRDYMTFGYGPWGR